MFILLQYEVYSGTYEVLYIQFYNLPFTLQVILPL